LEAFWRSEPCAQASLTDYKVRMIFMKVLLQFLNLQHMEGIIVIMISNLNKITIVITLSLCYVKGRLPERGPRWR
jgi:hypothetical protein